MSYSIQCVHCKAVLKSPAPVPGGKQVKCPKCKQTFTTPRTQYDKTAEIPNDSGAPPVEKPAPAVKPDGLGDDDMEAAIAKLQTDQAGGKKPAAAPVSPPPPPVPKPTQLSPPVDEDDELAAAVAKLEAEQAAGKKPAPALPPPAIPNMEISDIMDGDVLPDEDEGDPTEVIDVDTVDEVEEEEEPPAKKKRRGADADEEDEPRSKKKRRDEEEEDEPVSKKKRREKDEEDEDEEDEAPRSKKKRRADEDEDEDEDDEARSKGKKKKAKAGGSMLWILLGGGIVALLACCGCGVGMYFSKSLNNQDILKLLNNQNIVGVWQGDSVDFVTKRNISRRYEFRRDGTATLRTSGALNNNVDVTFQAQEGNPRILVVNFPPLIIELGGGKKKEIGPAVSVRYEFEIRGDEMKMKSLGPIAVGEELIFKRVQ